MYFFSRRPGIKIEQSTPIAADYGKKLTPLI